MKEIYTPQSINQFFEEFKSLPNSYGIEQVRQLLNNPNVATVSNSLTIPGKNYEIRSYRRKDEAETFLFQNNH